MHLIVNFMLTPERKLPGDKAAMPNFFNVDHWRMLWNFFHMFLMTSLQQAARLLHGCGWIDI
jgi:hypothetical protein